MLFLKRFMIYTGILMSLFALTGCETVKGAGKDITNAAEAVDRAI